MLKLKMMLCVMDVAAGRRRSVISPGPSVSVKSPCLRRDNAAFDWQTPPNGLFHLQREADHYAKQIGRNLYINEQCR